MRSEMLEAIIVTTLTLYTLLKSFAKHEPVKVN